jgi:hypothetical protein
MVENKCIHEGICYPIRHVSAVFDERALAEAAAAALRADGFVDVGIFHGPEAYVVIRSRSQHDSAFTRAWRRIRDIGQEGEVHQQYLSTLRQGRSYVIVQAATSDEAEHARDIVVAHQGYNIWHLGQWTMEHLAEE